MAGKRRFSICIEWRDRGGARHSQSISGVHSQKHWERLSPLQIQRWMWASCKCHPQSSGYTSDATALPRLSRSNHIKKLNQEISPNVTETCSLKMKWKLKCWIYLQYSSQLVHFTKAVLGVPLPFWAWLCLWSAHK